MDQKGKAEKAFLACNITEVVEEIEAWEHVLLCVPNSGLTNKVKHTSWEGVTAALSEVRQKKGVMAGVTIYGLKL